MSHHQTKSEFMWTADINWIVSCCCHIWMDSYQRSWFHSECSPGDSHTDRSLADSGSSCLFHRSPGCPCTHSHPGHTGLPSNRTDRHTLLLGHTCPHLLHSYTPEHSYRHNLVIRKLKTELEYWILYHLFIYKLLQYNLNLFKAWWLQLIIINCENKM